MQNLAQRLRSILCVLALVCSGSVFAGQNILYYQSQAGDYIGQGAEVTFDGTSGTFVAIPNFSNGVVARFSTPTFSHLWTLNVSAPNNALLQPGSYEGAQRWPFQPAGSPGLDFSGDGRGCNTSSGRFDVLELVRDASGTVTQLAVNWEQHCEGAAPALFGQFRFNSDIPILKPLVIALGTPVNSRGCVEATSPNGARISVNVNDSIDNLAGRALKFNWSATTGSVGTGRTFTFTGPLTTDPLQPVVVTLSLTDLATKFVRTATKSICVSDTTGPTITINSPVPGQIVNGDSLILDVTIKDAVDKNLTQYEVLVGDDYSAPIDPSTGNARQDVLAKPQANGSVALTITVRAVDASGNVSQKSVTVTQFP